ncbi:hypothetical protein ABZ357_21405 [Streptomyces sp. NPDC005917]|uniref:hypothetical protein n=1 Tax=unclassified Streptomyces TaxID=2593676 RepID=UPI0033E96B9E
MTKTDPKTTDPKAIKRRLRELRADPGQPGARVEIQRLIGELRRAAQARDVTDMQGPANRRTAHRQERDHAGGDTSALSDEEAAERWRRRRLTGSNRRLGESIAQHPDGLSDQDREAMKTWPTELRARVADRRLSQLFNGRS